jgi:hypothetical protein
MKEIELLEKKLNSAQAESARLKTEQLQLIQEIHNLKQLLEQKTSDDQIEKLTADLASTNDKLKRITRENQDLRRQILLVQQENKELLQKIQVLTEENAELERKQNEIRESIMKAHDVLNTLSRFPTIKQGDYQTVLKEVRRILNIPEPAVLPLPPPPPPGPMPPLPPARPAPTRYTPRSNPPIKVGELTDELKKKLNRTPGFGRGGTRKKHLKHKKRKHTKRQKR